MAEDEAPVEVDAAVPGGQPRRPRRLGLALVIVVVSIAAILILGKLTHRPQLVYPDGAKRPILQVQSTSDVPVNPKLVDYYLKLYELDPCREGKKYATVCQDGEVIWQVEEGVCAAHGGVKDWVVCR